ncbi:unnamed protein product, partial [Rotaria sp. Silwood1]
MTECERLLIGREFLDSRSWPITLRNPGQDRCFCDRCYSSVYADTVTERGHTYVIPRGWTRFGIYIDEAFAKHHNVWAKWVNCFHGTTIENAKSIVEHRQFLLHRDVTMEGRQLKIREGHIPEEHYLFTTPTI